MDFDEEDNFMELGSYVLDCQNQKIIVEGETIDFIEEQIRPGMTITVKLDMEIGQLDFIINGVAYTALVSESLQSGKYYPTIHMATHFDCVQFVAPPVTSRQNCTRASFLSSVGAANSTNRYEPI